MKQYIVDAFTKEVFAGNPAAVCCPDRWPEDALMCRIAMENNLSETAFVVREGDASASGGSPPAGDRFVRPRHPGRGPYHHQIRGAGSGEGRIPDPQRTADRAGGGRAADAWISPPTS